MQTRTVRYQLPNDPKIREIALPTAYEPSPPPFVDVTIRNLDSDDEKTVRLRRHGHHEGFPFYAVFYDST